MKKVIRLTESDLTRIVKRVIREQESQNEIDKILNKVKNILSKLGVDAENMDTEELFYELKLAIEKNENKYYTHDLKSLYYEFLSFFGNKDQEDWSTIQKPKKEKGYDIEKIPFSDDENFSFLNDEDENDDDFLGNIGISRS